jgi:hypothetical protein
MDANPLKQPLIVRDDQGRTTAEVEVIQAVNLARRRSWQARWSRFNLNRENWNFYHGRQDFSHKMKHQSKEFLPDFPMAIEQIAGTIERSLVDFQDWFDIESFSPTQDQILEPATMRKLLSFFLSRLYVPGDQPETAYNFATLMGEAVKMGLLEATINLKVYAIETQQERYALEQGTRLLEMPHPNIPGVMLPYEEPYQTVQRVIVPQIRLAIDLIPWEDFFPDPTGENRYTIHEVTRSLDQLSANPRYKQEVVQRLQHNRYWGGSSTAGTQPEYERRRRSGQDYIETESYSPRIRETWGDVVRQSDGKVLLRNVLVTTAGDDELLSDPMPNPNWSGRRPFVSAPLIRVPLSSVHKAIADHAVPMARAQNEMMNLMIDGGLAAVWGIRQVRSDLLENPEEITDGIPQGYTGELKSGVPQSEKFLERVDDGAEPQYGVDILNRLSAAFQVATALPELSRGVLPPRQVKATEIEHAAAASQGLYGVISARLEDTVIQPTLELCWQTLWQYVDDFTEPELVGLLGARRALALQTMTQAQRFVTLTQGLRFKVRGLRSLATRQQDFAKAQAFLQTIGVNPALMQAFDLKYDILKFIDMLVKGLNIDPTTIEKDPDTGPRFDPNLLAGGEGPGAMAPGAPASGPAGTGGVESQTEKGFAEANPEGFRGSQL